ncbi:MAG: dicarboxylate/amino acid:cation symporter [Gammaproteobacteria bacterium]|nr:dicarboxylate/amino acid:cation symporter [Gammaproteobacteria bacterium]
MAMMKSFGNQCLIALILGALFGMIAPLQWVDALTPLGDAFIQLLKMIIIPITFILIVTSFTKLENISQIKELGGKTLFWFLTTAIIAALVGLLTALWINPGQGFHEVLPIDLKQPPALSQIFLDMVPGNLFDQIARGKVIPVIIFGILFAIALTLCKEEALIVRQFFDGLAKVFYKITRWIIRLSPIGIFVFISAVSAHYGITSLIPFGKFILTVYLACLIQLVIYGILLFGVCRTNPLKFTHLAWPMLLTAFTTSSSLATLPVTLDVLIKRLGISEQVASFVAPLGANAKMDGCGAIYPAIICIFTATLFQIPLDWHQYLIIVITATVASIGTAGVPGSAMVMTMVVLSNLGLPFAGLAMVMGIDKIIDMMRTTVNVAGTAVCATLVAAHTLPSTDETQPALIAPKSTG